MQIFILCIIMNNKLVVIVLSMNISNMFCRGEK